MENRKNHALNHLKPYIFGASVLKKDDREIREKEIFLDRLTAHPCFGGSVMLQFNSIIRRVFQKSVAFRVK